MLILKSLEIRPNTGKTQTQSPSDTQARLLREGIQYIFFHRGIMKIMTISTNTSKTLHQLMSANMKMTTYICMSGWKVRMGNLRTQILKNQSITN